RASCDDGWTPALRKASVTARYMAPESIWRYPRRRATAFAVVLLPDPAGPSIATITESQSYRWRVSSGRLPSSCSWTLRRIMIIRATHDGLQGVRELRNWRTPTELPHRSGFRGRISAADLAVHDSNRVGI